MRPPPQEFEKKYGEKSEKVRKEGENVKKENLRMVLVFKFLDILIALLTLKKSIIFNTPLEAIHISFRGKIRYTDV